METVHIIWGELAVSLYRQRKIDNSVRLAHAAYDFHAEAESKAFLFGISESRKPHMYAHVTNLPDIRALGMPFRTRILEAVLKGDADTVEEMLKAGVDVNSKAPNGMTLLEISADRGDEAVVEKLLDHGAEIERTEDSPFSALHLGAASFYPGSGRVVDLLTDRKVNIDRSDLDGKSPLIKAIEASRLEVALKLIEKGAKVHIPDNNGLTARDHFEKKFGGLVGDPLKDKFETALEGAEKEYVENKQRMTSFMRHPTMNTPYHTGN